MSHSTIAAPDASTDRAALANRYSTIRQFSDELCAPLEPEDCVIQSMPDISPTRWHLAHTTWFFETFILRQAVADYEPLHPEFNYLFNSYYNALGQPFPRDRRGLLSRPTVREVFDYRCAIDGQMQRMIESAAEATLAAMAPLIELGLEHEQQHQELILTDIKHVLSCNPLQPIYHPAGEAKSSAAAPPNWKAYDGGLHSIGYDGPSFHYDNEAPRHQVFLQPFRLADRLVTNEEYLEFIGDGGYQRPELWLSAGWATVQQHAWQAPLYWHRQDDQSYQFTLAGARPLVTAEPVCHVSYFEADAYARWAGCRLPTEFEWERVAEGVPIAGNFADSRRFHPAPASDSQRAAPRQLFGDVWEWTSSSYAPYPGYRPAPGAVGEYNGKFMCNQYVLRGGSCATSQSHIRATYRNFFPPEARWQFSGIRLCQ